MTSRLSLPVLMFLVAISLYLVVIVLVIGKVVQSPDIVLALNTIFIAIFASLTMVFSFVLTRDERTFMRTVQAMPLICRTCNHRVIGIWGKETDIEEIRCTSHKCKCKTCHVKSKENIILVP
jgi:hypothetical protein